MYMRTKICCIALFFLLLATSAAKGTEKLVLMLDWFPNVDHVPIYAAIESGFFEKRGYSSESLGKAHRNSPDNPSLS